jgi:hypothetical protein
LIESLLAKGKKIKKGNDQKIKKNISVLPSITVRNLTKINKKIRVFAHTLKVCLLSIKFIYKFSNPRAS